MDRIRTLAWVYVAGFIFIAFMGYIPAFLDAEGNLFGLFKLDLYDNGLHLASGLWAGAAALRSAEAARGYFRLFGPLYFGDGVMGLLAGSTYLDFGIFLYGPLDLPAATRFFANLPHLVIGGGAIVGGYFLARRTLSAAR